MPMSFDSERSFEEALVALLRDRKGWKDGVLNQPSEEELVANWAAKLFAANRGPDRLNGVPLTDGEMRQVVDQVNACPTPEKKNRFVNGKSVQIVRDNPDDELNFGKAVSLQIYDRDQIAGGKSCYQIARQPRFKASRDVFPERRGDVMLLINGMPLFHIELKRSGVDVTQAAWQIENYSHEGVFDHGIYSLVQVFVAMTPEETLYFANPGSSVLSGGRHFNRDFMFHWADENNVARDDWTYIAENMLSIPMAHKMVGFYTVADAGDGVLKVMRSYQYYAASAISDVVARCDWSRKPLHGGYVFHTTGSGKTMTSFKAAQLVASMPTVNKAVFLVDRIELGDQSLAKYRDFADTPEEVNETDDTRALVKLLASKHATSSLIVSSIQKAALIGSEDAYATAKQMGDILAQNIVFIVDECHQDTFGEMMSSIRKTFPHALLFGFTGTPIYFQNKKRGLVTEDVFGPCLHLYTISDGIRDGNVLGFDPVQVRVYPDEKLREAVALNKAKADSVEEAYADPAKKKVFLRYMNEVPMASLSEKDGDLENVKGIEDLVPAVQWEQDEYRRAVVKDIVDRWPITSVDRKYHAIFATSSREEAIEYWRFLRKTAPELNVSALFTPDIPNDESGCAIAEGLADILEDYARLFGREFTIPTHAAFKSDVSDRLAHRGAYKNVGKDRSRQLDILVVVDQMLTGYDSKWVNMLYLDKVLEYERLIQAFSRTNRLCDSDKPFGSVRYYRKPHTMARNIERAVKLYAGTQPLEPFVPKLGLNIVRMNALFEQIRLIFRGDGIEGFERIPASVEDRASFAKLFKELNDALNAARIQGFVWSQREYGADYGVDPAVEIVFDEDAYLVLVLRYKELFDGNNGTGDGGEEAPYPVDVNITTVNTDRIDRDYMQNKFVRWTKSLGQENVSPEEVQAFLDDLHTEFAKLDQADQAIAEGLIHDIQGGDIQLDPGKTFADYMNERRAAENDHRIAELVSALGVDRERLVELMRIASRGGDVEGHGRYAELCETVDYAAAAAFFEAAVGAPLPKRIVRREADVLLSSFVKSGGFDLEPYIQARLAKEKSE